MTNTEIHPAADLYTVRGEEGMFLALAFVGAIEPPVDANGDRWEDMAPWTPEEFDDLMAEVRAEWEAEQACRLLWPDGGLY